MKKHKKLIISLIVVILLIIFIIVFFIIKNKNNKSFENTPRNMGQFNETSGTSKEKMDRFDKQTKKSTTLKTNAEIKSALSENVELHATYYLEEIYVEENQFVEAGENILKYTNGTYLVAPYDCYITDTI